MKRFHLAFLFFFFLISSSSFALDDAIQPPVVDQEPPLPAIFNNSWIGISFGKKKTDFELSDLTTVDGLQSIKDSIAAIRLTVGHYFNPYFAMTLDFLRGVHSNKFYYPDTMYSVPESLFGMTIRPTFPFNDGIAFFGEVGLGFISRRGFQAGEIQVVTNDEIVTPIVGAGFNLNLPYNLFLDVEATYIPRVPHAKQPSILYLGAGLNYLISASKEQTPVGPFYWFPENIIQLNYVNKHVFYADVARYFTTPRSIPVFFDGAIKIENGTELMYERTFFHTAKNFSIDWGLSVADWQSHFLKQAFYTFSIFPEIKVWIIRMPRFDFYFTYSLAGPTYISRVYIDNRNSGSHFTFQDFLGFGAFIGESKRAALEFKIIHYSNGNTLPHNPGVCVPIMAGLSIAF